MNLDHHAYLIEGDWENFGDNLVKKIETAFSITRVGNPDFLIHEEESFGIDNARALRESASRKSLHPTGIKIFLLSFLSITTEAQNALLKLFEEPTEDTHFFILTPSINSLLPTLISRVESLELNIQSQSSDIDVEKFMKADIADRFKLVSHIIESRDKGEAIKICSKIEEKLSGNLTEPTSANFLEELLKIKGYLSDRSPSVKMLMEYLVLSAPRV